MASPLPWRVVRKERLYHRTHDRYLLEEVIFKQLLAQPDTMRLLFVGCDVYTADYPNVFAGRRFITIDCDPMKARYGSEHHVVDTVANLPRHVEPASLDAVIFNGVLGWGLESREEIERAVGGCFESLRPGGLFILGWNDMSPWRPVHPKEIEGLGAFVPTVLPPFPTTEYQTLGAMRHVFNFYHRPEVSSGAG